MLNAKLTNKQKADKLREAIALLMDADNVQQAALGSAIACEDIHNNISDIIDTLREGIEEFESVA
jgi:hypothetical protein